MERGGTRRARRGRGSTMAAPDVPRGRSWAARRSVGDAHPVQLPRRCGRPRFPAARGGALRRDRAARHVDHGAGAQGLRREDGAALCRRRLLHQDAREPAADRPYAGRGRLHVLRVLGLRHHGILRGRRPPRPPHHAALRYPTMRRPFSCPVIRMRRIALCWMAGATAANFDGTEPHSRWAAPCAHRSSIVLLLCHEGPQ